MKFPRLCVKESFDQSLPDDHLLGYICPLITSYYVQDPFESSHKNLKVQQKFVLSCSETELTEHLLCLFHLILYSLSFCLFSSLKLNKLTIIFPMHKSSGVAVFQQIQSI